MQKQETPLLKERIKREIFAILYFVMAFVLLLSLVTSLMGAEWMGKFGDMVSFGIFFVFGKYVSFLLIGILVLWGFSQFKECPESPESKKLLRFAGALILMFSLCTLLALPFDPDTDRIRHFAAGGLLGSYVTYKLGIKQAMGPVGSYIVSITGVLIGIVMTTEFLISVYISSLKEKMKENKAAKAEKTPLPPVAKASLAAEDPVPEVAAEVAVPLSMKSSIEEELGPRIVIEEEDRKKLPIRKPVAPPKPVVPGEYILPSLDLLREPPPNDIEKTLRQDLLDESKKLEETLNNFGIDAKVIEVNRGPVVTRFELQPAPGVKISSITGLSNDIALAMRAAQVRIAPIAGKAAVGIEVPNRTPSAVFLREILSADAFQKPTNKLIFAVGKTISGDPFVADLARMPHMLIAGTTGSGKSVCINGIIASFLYRARPDEVKFIMIDPKKVELSIYSDIPHLLTPIVTEAKKAARALKWAVMEMERRYSLFADLSVRDIDGYYELLNKIKEENRDPMDNAAGVPLERIPLIVVIIDELADLMMVARADIEDMICRLAQMARAVGIHLVLATQRPSVDVITGLIKANFPSRIAFQVSSRIDSRTILDSMGAEALLGRGDMLFAPGGTPKPIRLQGSFVSNNEIQAICDFIREQCPPEYQVTSFDQEEGMEEGESGEDRDVLYEEAIKIIRKTRQASASLLQTHLGIGYPRARKIIEQMERDGVVGPMRGSKPREIFLTSDND
jgi:S-DNA-T family DNA segregation ATPase FtsK/SpoIIIE